MRTWMILDSVGSANGLEQTSSKAKSKASRRSFIFGAGEE